MVFMKLVTLFFIASVADFELVRITNLSLEFVARFLFAVNVHFKIIKFRNVLFKVNVQNHYSFILYNLYKTVS